MKVRKNLFKKKTDDADLIEQEIDDVGALAGSSWTDEQRSFLVCDHDVHEVRVSDSVDVRNDDLVVCCILRNWWRSLNNQQSKSKQNQLPAKNKAVKANSDILRAKRSIQSPIM